MKNIFIASIMATLAAGAAVAESPLSGEVELEFKENPISEKIAGTMNLDLGINVGTVSTVDLDFGAKGDGSFNGSSLKLNDWTVGTNMYGVGVEIGTDNSVFVEAEGEQTLADPAMTESVKVTVGNVAVAVGFDDFTRDVSELSNIQGSYTTAVQGYDVTVSADRNLNTDNTVVGSTVSGFSFNEAALSGTVTYDTDAETFGYEGVATRDSITAYVNGDDEDVLQNVGGEYVYGLGEGVELSAGANYNLDTEDFAPTAGISFKF